MQKIDKRRWNEVKDESKEKNTERMELKKQESKMKDKPK